MPPIWKDDSGLDWSSFCMASENDVSISRAAAHGMRTKSLDVQREELLVLDKITDFKTVGGTTRRTGDDYAGHDESRMS